MPFGRICAVVVTYHPGPEFEGNIQALLPQVERIVIIDNGSNDAELLRLTELAQAYPGHVEWHEHTANNLAAAQNRGIEHARKDGFDWVLLMDDDSRPDDAMIKAVQGYYESVSGADAIGILAPSIRDINTALPMAHTFPWRYFGFKRQVVRDILINPYFVIASGSFIRVETLENVGLMDEGFSIDYVDCDFCLRMLKAGFEIHVVGDAVLHHRPGARQANTFLGWQFFPSHYSPLRRYTITRNRLRSWGRHGAKAPGFVLFDALALGGDIFKMAFYEDDKLAKMTAMCHGIVDALLGMQTYPRFFRGRRG